MDSGRSLKLSMVTFPIAGAAFAGLKVLSVVDRKDRRMFALERVGRSDVRGSFGPHARERPHPRRRLGNGWAGFGEFPDCVSAWNCVLVDSPPSGAR